jgi:hypothetical protein
MRDRVRLGLEPEYVTVRPAEASPPGGGRAGHGDHEQNGAR